MTAVGNPASAADAEEPPRSAGLLEPPPGADGTICSPDPGDVDELASEPALRPPTEDELAQLADLAFATATAWLSVPDRFYTLARGAGIDPDSAPAQPLRRALGFFLTEETKSGRRSVELRWKTGFHTDALPPPRLRSVAASEAEVWQILADKVTHPAARARLLDVLVLRGGKDTPERAAAAIEAYLDHATTPTTVIKRTDGEDVETSWLYRGLTLSLGRALSLAHIAAGTATGKASAERAVTVALSHAGARTRSSRPQAGSVISTLSLLAANRTLLSPAETAMLLSLIEEAAARYADLDNAIDQLMSLLVLLDPARREDAHRLRVQTRLNLAVGKEPMVAMRFLEDAARLARTFHLDDLRDEAVREMQRLARLDHGLQTVSANVTIPGPILDAEVRRASDGADWRESMSSWLATPAPSGDLATNERTSRNVASRSLVRQLASTVLLGADNMPRWRPETEADKDAYELSRTESLRMTLAGQLLSEALDRIVGLHGVPPVAELAMFLTGNGRGDVTLANALARSFHRYWDGDYEGSLHTAAVRVESGARALVMLLDEPAYTVARNNAQGKYVGLDQLLDILVRRDFDPDWDRFIRTLLLGPTGQNLRHDVAHGFILSEPSPSTAALALRACSLFAHLLWKASPVCSADKGPSLPKPAWTITDAVRGTIGTATRSPQLIPALLRAEVAALRSILKRER